MTIFAKGVAMGAKWPEVGDILQWHNGDKSLGVKVCVVGYESQYRPILLCLEVNESVDHYDGERFLWKGEESPLDCWEESPLDCYTLVGRTDHGDCPVCETNWTMVDDYLCEECRYGG